MVDAAALASGETALDVGAGQGAIAAEAAARGAKVVAIEVDPVLAAGLRARNVALEVVEGDALVVPLPRVDAVVSNPPFKVAAPIVLRLLDVGFGRAVLVLPAELVERLLARPGGERYGRLTVQVAARATATPLFRLKRRDLDPPPEVDVAVVRLAPRPAPGADLTLLDVLLAHAFESRRRKLRHGLGRVATELRISSGRVTEALRATDSEDALPGDLDVEQWLDLARRVSGSTGGNERGQG